MSIPMAAKYTPEEARQFTKRQRSKAAVCPQCGHPVAPDEIKGILKGKQKAVYEVIARAGGLGISTQEIMDIVYAGHPDGGPTWNTLSATARIINKKIECFGLMIRSERGWGASCYRLLPIEEVSET
jgi:hypothetical protein